MVCCGCYFFLLEEEEGFRVFGRVVGSGDYIKGRLLGWQTRISKCFRLLDFIFKVSVIPRLDFRRLWGRQTRFSKSLGSLDSISKAPLFPKSTFRRPGGRKPGFPKSQGRRDSISKAALNTNPTRRTRRKVWIRCDPSP